MEHFGLSDTINSDLSSSNKNLDIHMQKNTEFGGYALLSASQYGNPNKITDGGTTTGNASGIVMKINKEWVAAGAGLERSTYAKNAKARYINNDYTASNVMTGNLHKGDTLDIGNWHSSTSTKWIWSKDWDGFLRAYSGSIFSYYGTGDTDYYYYDSDGDAKSTKPWYSRAIVVVGTGI